MTRLRECQSLVLEQLAALFPLQQIGLNKIRRLRIATHKHANLKYHQALLCLKQSCEGIFRQKAIVTWETNDVLHMVSTNFAYLKTLTRKALHLAILHHTNQARIMGRTLPSTTKSITKQHYAEILKITALVPSEISVSLPTAKKT